MALVSRALCSSNHDRRWVKTKQSPSRRVTRTMWTGDVTALALIVAGAYRLREKESRPHRMKSTQQLSSPRQKQDINR